MSRPVPRRWIVSLTVLLAVLLGGSHFVLADVSDLPARYRDFRVYTTSQPAADDPATIAATITLVNRGERPLSVEATLPASEVLGFEGGSHTASLAPGSESTWAITLRPQEGLTREVLAGSIQFGDVKARDLFIAFIGPDPEGFESKDLEPNADRAKAAATYAPRTREAIDLLKAAAQPQGEPVLVLAAQGETDLRLLVPMLPEQAGASGGADGAAAIAAWRETEGLSPQETDLIDALDDLVRVVKVQSGATLPVVRELPGEGNGRAIQLRLTDSAPGNPGGKPWAHPDAYRLAISSQGVLIESGTLDGLRQGVFGLLTDHLDAHWFFPRELGEEIVVPDDQTIRLHAADEVHEPSFFSVTGMSWGNSPRWDRRNRALIHRGQMSFGHAWHGLINPAEFPYDEHPEMWARDREGNILKFDKGWSHTNFCTTDEKVLEVVAEKINRQLSNPEAIVASLDPNDLAPFCLCDDCLAVDASYGVTDQDGTYASDRLLHFSKEIHNRLDEANKEKFLGILVYGYQVELPTSAKPHAQHVGMICNMPWTFDHTRPFDDPTSPRNVKFHELVKGWGDRLTQLGYYDYYGHWAYWGPWSMVHKLREELPLFRDLGGTFLVIEAQPNFTLHGLNHYVAAQLAWDVDQDADLLMDELFEKYYGPAAEPMRQFWLAGERHYALSRPGSNVHLQVGHRPGLWEELEGHLAEAANAAADAPQRFRDRVQVTREGLEWGRRRFAVEGQAPIRLHRPDTVERVEADPALIESLIAQLQSDAEALDATYEKYPPDDAYWPPLTAGYFRPQVEAVIQALQARLAKEAATAETTE